MIMIIHLGEVEVWSSCIMERAFEQLLQQTIPFGQGHERNECVQELRRDGITTVEALTKLTMDDTKCGFRDAWRKRSVIRAARFGLERGSIYGTVSFHAQLAYSVVP
jgi:hypothetical protein